jgi:hypothetical protein
VLTVNGEWKMENGEWRMENGKAEHGTYLIIANEK